MEYIQRKVFLTKYLRPFDSDGDGVMDSLILSATTKTIQIPLTQSYDDMGIYDISDEETVDIIDINSVFNDGIPGGSVTQPTGTTTTTISWGTGTINYVTTGDTIDLGSSSSTTNSATITFCSDTTALNYQQLSLTSNGSVLINSDGTTVEYPSPQPKFMDDLSTCKYNNGGVIPTDGGVTVGSEVIECLTTNYTPTKWVDFQLTAKSNADTHCASLGKTSVRISPTAPSAPTPLCNGGLPGGSVFNGVSNCTTTSRQRQIGTRPAGNVGEIAVYITEYNHKYCFYCQG